MKSNGNNSLNLYQIFDQNGEIKEKFEIKQL